MIRDPSQAEEAAGSLATRTDLTKPDPVGLPTGKGRAPWTLGFQPRGLGVLVTVRADRAHKYETLLHKWEAYKIFHDDGTVMKIQNIELIRGIDHLAGGRLATVWVGEDQTAFAFHYNLQFSDDGGATWSARDALNVSTSTPPLGRDYTRFGGLIAWNNKFMAFTRGLISTGADPPWRKIYRSVWDAGWGAPSLWYSRADHVVSRVRPARSRDRTVAALAFFEQNVNTLAMMVRYVPMDSVGDPGTAENVGDPGAATTEIALVFDGTNPKVIITDGTVIRKKTKSGGAWPASWTDVTIDDPPTDPDILAVHATFPLLTWGGGAFASNGNAHALKKTGGAANRNFIQRERVNGTWAQETIDFGALAVPMSGSGSEEYAGEHILGMWLSSDPRTYGIVWMTAPAGVRPFTIWFVRRKVPTA